ncbi:MAG: NTP transferase domain-containing protein [Verrucomicrobiota bacterium]|nr:NTP transferase domain-containing protein [Verrucomicrobiota bacterium]
MEFEPTTILDAVILMAGAGSRLRASRNEIPKPLVPILGRPLISYTIDALHRAGVRKFHAVVGAESDRMIAGLRPLLPAGMTLNVIPNDEWKKQNGVSLLQAEGHLAAPFLLLMADHLFDEAVLETLVRQSDPEQLNLAVDRKLGAIFDLDDAMKVQTEGERVTGIGKTLSPYDAIDTGAFLCSLEIFRYLRAAQNEEGDCSLAEGVRLMAHDRKVRAIDIGSAWWQDVDTPEMLRHAESILRRLRPAVPLSVLAPR